LKKTSLKNPRRTQNAYSAGIKVGGLYQGNNGISKEESALPTENGRMCVVWLQQVRGRNQGTDGGYAAANYCHLTPVP
jgi:hypothetical protein